MARGDGAGFGIETLAPVKRREGEDGCAECERRPYVAKLFLLGTFPALKRGANKHCAYGAVEIGTTRGCETSEPRGAFRGVARQRSKEDALV